MSEVSNGGAAILRHACQSLCLSICLAAGALTAAAAAQRTARPPIEEILPDHFGFGVSWFGGNRTWPKEAKEQYGVNWDFVYVYGFPTWKGKTGTNWGYLNGVLFQRAKSVNAIPIISFYGLLQMANSQGYKGTEAQRIRRVVEDPVAMKAYMEEVKRILIMCNRYDGKRHVIFHSEPDSWLFLQWGEGWGRNTWRDPTKTFAAVKSSGMADAQDFPDTVAGLAKALLHIRDTYAPKVYMGFHSKCAARVDWPDLQVKFIRELGQWDILIGDGIGHVLKTRGDGWWDAWDERRHNQYMKWFGTVTKELGLKYIHWQSVIGKADYTLMPDYPDKQRITDYIKAGSVGVCFDLRVGAGQDPGTTGRSDPNHGYTANPPPDHPAQKTPNDLRERLSRYYRQPIPLDLRVARKDKRKSRERKPIILPDGTEIIIVGGIPIRRRRKAAPVAEGETPAVSSAESPPPGGQAPGLPARGGPKDEGPEPAPSSRRPKSPESDESRKPTQPTQPTQPKEPPEPPEIRAMFKEAESLFIDGDLDKAVELFRKIVDEHTGTPSAAKAAEYLEIVE